MEALIIQTGQKFNFLTIICEANPSVNEDGLRPKRRFICECVCGAIVNVRLDALRNNKKASCGCSKTVPIVKTGNHVLVHGLCGEELYKSWKNIRSRCYSKNDPNYRRYGGRGIKMSDEWYASPKKFIDWALNNGYKKGLQCDRRNNNDGYSEENCRWVTSEVNNNNKGSNIKYNFNGNQLTLPQIAKVANIRFSALYRRINENKLSLEEALAIPLYGKCKKDTVEKRKFDKQRVVSIYMDTAKVSLVAQKYGVSKSTVRRIRKKETYSDFTDGIK